MPRRWKGPAPPQLSPDSNSKSSFRFRPMPSKPEGVSGGAGRVGPKQEITSTFLFSWIAHNAQLHSQTCRPYHSSPYPLTQLRSRKRVTAQAWHLYHWASRLAQGLPRADGNEDET